MKTPDASLKLPTYSDRIASQKAFAQDLLPLMTSVKMDLRPASSISTLYLLNQAGLDVKHEPLRVLS